MFVAIRMRGNRSVPSFRPGALLRGVVLVLLVASAPLAKAQTIVPNAHLTNELAPWEIFVSSAPDPLGSGTAPTWVAAPDIFDSPDSGSALVRIATSMPAENAASGIGQCVEFTSPTTIDFLNYGMAFRVPAATTLEGSLSATVEIRLFSGGDCTGFISGGTQAQTLAPGAVLPDTWYRIGDTGFVPVGAPIVAASAEIRGYLRQTGVFPSQSDYAINLDHFVLVLNSTTPVGLIHFDVE